MPLVLFRATRANPLNGQLGFSKLKSRRQRQRETGLHLLQAEHLAAAGAMEMRMAMLGLGDGDRIEAPDPIAPFDLVRQVLRDQPIQHAVERDPVEIEALRMRFGFDFLMAQRTRRQQ